jgi:hypothetical protein
MSNWKESQKFLRVVSEEKFLLSPKGSKRDIHVKKERKGIL